MEGPWRRRQAGIVWMSVRFARLKDLAQERSSDKRRELLREVTDMFFVSAETGRTSAEAALFDSVLREIAMAMQDKVLRELAERFSGAPDAPIGLMRDLANHAFEVAEPVLRRSTVLGEADLVAIVEKHGEDHRRAIAQRERVSERVSSALVARGDNTTLRALVANAGAEISRTDFETVFERARSDDALTQGIVNRADAPLDLLNDIVFAVSAALRAQILARNAVVDRKGLDLALERARARVERRNPGMSEAYAAAETDVRRKASCGQLSAATLIAYYRADMREHFLVGLAHLTDVDVSVADSVIERGDMDALAMMCRASGIERPLFVTMAVLACGGQRAMDKAEEFGQLYTDVPIEAAQRAMRFYRIRRTNADAAARALG
jgi:uncharacterized protein (DUF2336 family)